MMRDLRLFLACGCLLALTTKSMAGPFDAFSDSGVATGSISAWANSAVNYLPSATIDSGADNPANAVGPADGTTVSLGDLNQTEIQSGATPGTITVSFENNIFDGPGTDFAVFENASEFFGGPFIFAELAFVEVSSNGSDFARFPSTSLNLPPVPNPNFDQNEPPGFDNPEFLGVDHLPTTDEIDAGFGRGFAGINTTNVNNLAGVHPGLSGTPFDLSDLAGHALVIAGDLDLDAVSHIRMIDIPGNGDIEDSFGNPILDAWLTVGTGGFDLDAVGALHVVPEPSSLALAGCFGLAVLLRKKRS